MSVHTQRLEVFLKRMQELLEDNDTEAAHSEADDLLVSTLLHLPLSSTHQATVKRIVDAYEQIEKWFA